MIVAGRLSVVVEVVGNTPAALVVAGDATVVDAVAAAMSAMSRSASWPVEQPKASAAMIATHDARIAALIDRIVEA